MNSSTVKNILLSFSVVGGLLIIVNIIGKLAIQPKIVSSTQDVKQPLAIKSVKIKPEAEAFKAPLDRINLINYLRTLSDDTKASAD